MRGLSFAVSTRGFSRVWFGATLCNDRRYWEPAIYLRVLRLQNKDARLFTAQVHIRLLSHSDLDNPDSLDFRASRTKSEERLIHTIAGCCTDLLLNFLASLFISFRAKLSVLSCSNGKDGLILRRTRSFAAPSLPAANDLGCLRIRLFGSYWASLENIWNLNQTSSKDNYKISTRVRGAPNTTDRTFYGESKRFRFFTNLKLQCNLTLLYFNP